MFVLILTELADGIRDGKLPDDKTLKVFFFFIFIKTDFNLILIHFYSVTHIVSWKWVAW